MERRTFIETVALSGVGVWLSKHPFPGKFSFNQIGNITDPADPTLAERLTMLYNDQRVGNLSMDVMEPLVVFFFAKPLFVNHGSL